MATQALTFDYEVKTTKTFDGTVSIDEGSGLVTLSDTNGGGTIGPVQPMYIAPYVQADLVDAINVAAVIGMSGMGGIQLKRDFGGQVGVQHLVTVPVGG